LYIPGMCFNFFISIYILNRRGSPFATGNLGWLLYFNSSVGGMDEPDPERARKSLIE